MSAIAASVTARCVHCAWRTDTELGAMLDEVRNIHELVHPGGTVLVGAAGATWGNAEPPVGSDEEPKREAQGRRPRGYWTPERIIEAFRTFHAEHGRWPLQSELRAPLLPRWPALKREFGGFSEAVEAAGLAGSAPSSTPATRQPKRTPAAPLAPAAAPVEAWQVTDAGTLAADASRLCEVVGEIWATREKLLNLQSEALALLEELRQEIEA